MRTVSYFAFRRTFWVCLFLIGSKLVSAQSDTLRQSVSTEQIIIENADQAIVQTDVQPNVTKYLGNVRAYHDGAFIFCDNAILTGNNLYAIGNVTIIEHDTIQIYSDTLVYQGDSSVAFLIKDVILINGKDTLYSPELKYNLNTKVSEYKMRALMKNANNELKSQSGFYNTSTKDAGFFDKVTITGDSLNLITDTLFYNTETTKAVWNAPCLIEQKGSKLFSNTGEYNINEQYGFFVGNAQYETDTAKAVADTIFYSGLKNLIELSGDAVYESLSDTASAQKIIYDKGNDIIKLSGDANYVGDGNRAKGEEITYDKKTESFEFTGRSALEDGSVFIEADNLNYQKKTKEGLAIGGVIYRDTSEKITIWGDTLVYNGETNFMRATSRLGKPVMATEIDGDTVYISGRILRTFQVITYPILLPTDSLSVDSTKISGLDSRSRIDSILVLAAKDSTIDISMPLDSSLLIKTSDTIIDNPTKKDSVYKESVGTKFDSLYLEDSITLGDSTLRIDSSLVEVMSVKYDSSRADTVQYLVVEKDVVLYKADLQARCDSLYFSDKDSVFVLIKEPVIWSDTSQITGDTIKLKLLNKKIDELFVNENALMLNSPDFKFFNQIRGKLFVGKFEDSALKTMRVNGNAQIVYYMLDEESAYIGVNTTDCSYMSFLFEEKKVSDIRFYNSPQSKILPIRGTDHEGLKLKGFLLRFDERPISKDELFEPTAILIEDVDPVIEDSEIKKEDSEDAPPAHKD